ncbi:MAG: OmpA family protein [Bacteroidota bacterium]
MSDLAKGITGLFIWLLLTIGSYLVTEPYICGNLPFCQQQTTVVKADKANGPVETVRLPLDFKKSDSTPFTNAGFEQFKKTILNEKKEDHFLEITGYYYDEERNSSTFANLGLARANALQLLFANDVPVENIRLKAIKAPIPFDKNTPYVRGAVFNWIPAPKTSTVEVFADRTVIRFPFNSVQKEIDPAIDLYLDQLSARIRASKEKVSLTGHTDNVGEETINAKLALRRAKMIRDILIQKGVNRNQIKTYSKGETAPLANNNTEAGRKKNRRVVVRLIKAN